MFNLSARVAQHPINDEPYMRHLRTADVFNEVQAARLAAFEALAEVETAMAKHEAAVTAYEAAQAKAESIAGVEAMITEMENL